MKLLTHNMLSCHIKGVKNGYPFKIDPVKVIVPGLWLPYLLHSSCLPQDDVSAF